MQASAGIASSGAATGRVCTLGGGLSTWVAATHALTRRGERRRERPPLSAQRQAPLVSLSAPDIFIESPCHDCHRRHFQHPSEDHAGGLMPISSVWNSKIGSMKTSRLATRSVRCGGRSISEGESQQFNALVLDMHPYVSDQIFAETEGLFGKRLGWLAPSSSPPALGLVATNCINAFSLRLRQAALHQAHLHRGDTICTIRNLENSRNTKDLGLIRLFLTSFQGGEGELSALRQCEDHPDGTPLTRWRPAR